MLHFRNPFRPKPNGFFILRFHLSLPYSQIELPTPRPPEAAPADSRRRHGHDDQRRKQNHLTPSRLRFAQYPHDLQGSNDLLLLIPDVIRAIHAEYLLRRRHPRNLRLQRHLVSAGRLQTGSIVYELNVAGAKLARDVCDEFTAEP